MNRFDFIMEDSFAAEGISLTKSQVLSLQVALNSKWNASPKLVEDGIIGTKTKQALSDAGFNYPISQDEYNAVLAGGKSSASSGLSNLSEAQLKDLWKKSKDRFGGLNKKAGLSDADNFQKWLQRQKLLSGLKDFGKGIFGVGSDWLKQKQSGVTTDAGTPDDNAPIPTRNDLIWGMPAPVVYIGGAVVGGLIILGIIAMARKAGGTKTVIVQAPVAPPTASPAVG